MLRRLIRLYAGLALFGASIALMVRAGLGLGPWDVLHQGLSRQTGLPIGWVVIGVAAIVMLAWIPLRQRPGIGTLSNVVLVGLALEATLAELPRPDAISVRCAFLVTGIVSNGLATAMYIGADFGPGPRDGLMIGLAQRGHSIRMVRTSIEFTILAAGWLLDGTVGVGTVAYAVSIGALIQFFLRGGVPPREALSRPAARILPPRDRGSARSGSDTAAEARAAGCRARRSGPSCES
jgi:uncharacterized membrane protein YczE